MWNPLFSCPGGNGLLTASADGYLRLWRLPDGELVKKIPGPREGLQSLAINPQASEVWALSKSGSPLKIQLRNSSKGTGS
jgi:WD40 repeat protein